MIKDNKSYLTVDDVLGSTSNDDYNKNKNSVKVALYVDKR